MRDSYLQRDNPAFESFLEQRRADSAAAFLLPHLRPGMRVLDVGCGPGTITLDLAARVAPGEVVGFDIQPAMVARASALAAERRLANVRFEVADAYALPVVSGSFDAALAHMVLMHLEEPVRALAEIRRGLVPGGVIGVVDADLGTTVRWPSSPVWERFLQLRLRCHAGHSGGTVGRRHREVLLAAGFDRTEGSAQTAEGGSGTLERTRRQAEWLRSQLVGVGRTALAEGWADQAELDAMASDIDAWADRSDAMFFTVTCRTLGWTSG